VTAAPAFLKVQLGCVGGRNLAGEATLRHCRRLAG
jgi:hypothetical protein